MNTLLLLGLLALTVFAQEYEMDGDVLVLTDENYERATQEHEFIMLEFYAPWCKHCQDLAEGYKEAATALKAEGVKLAKIDATVQKTSAEKYGVKGYPTLKFIVKGVEKEYSGARNKDGIVNWVLGNLNPESENLETLEQVQESINANKVQLVYFSEDGGERDRELRKYKEFSVTLKQHFAHIVSKSVKEHFKLPQGVNFVGFKDGQPYFYQGKLKFSDMKIFVENLVNGWIMNFADKKALIEERFSKSKPVVIVFSEEEGAIEAAKKFVLEDIVFVKNVDEETLRRLIIRPADTTGLFGIKGDQKYFKVNQSAIEFVEQFYANKATKYLKTQAIPQQTSGLVKVLVGQTYESAQNGSDTIIFYYDSANSEHLVVEEQYAKIAERLQQNKGLTFAQIDVGQNEVSDMNESMEVVKLRIYKGTTFTKFIIRANKLQDERFVKWIIDNASVPVKDPKADL